MPDTWALPERWSPECSNTSRRRDVYKRQTSHRAYSKEEMEKVGITMGQLRFSVGLEDIDDILEELDKALTRV